jgi:hypothetical protein
MKIQYILGVTSLLLSTQILAKDFDYKLSVAAVGMNMDYREYDNGELLDTENSDINGITGVELKASYLKVDNVDNSTQLGINYMILNGETQYMGSLLSSDDGYGSYVGVTDDTITDIELEYKHIYKLSNDFKFISGVGFGYREWRRELSATQVEIYSWYSFRPKIGLDYKYNNFSLSTFIEYQYGINPEMLVVANSENPDTTVNLGSANIVEFSIPIKYTVSEKIDIFAEYMYQSQIIEKSNKVPYISQGRDVLIYEPRSESYNQYLKLGVEFKF